MFLELNPAYIISFLFIITCVCYVIFSVVTLVGKAERAMRRDYLITGVCLFSYSLSYAIMTVAQSEELVRIFWAVGYSSGLLFFPTWIRFLMHMIPPKGKRTGHLLKASLAVTLLIAVLCVWLGDVEFSMNRHGNQFSYNGNIFFIIAFVNSTILSVPLFLLLTRWWRVAAMQRHRKLGTMLMAITALAAPVGYVTDFVMPIFTNTMFIPLGPMSILIASVPTYFTIIANKSLDITVRNVSGYTFSSVVIPILVLDSNNSIMLENKAATELFGSSTLGKNMADALLLDNKPPQQRFFEESFESRTLIVKAFSGNRVCDMLLTVEKDKLGETYCKVVILRDVTDSRYKDSLLETLNIVSATLLAPDIRNFEDDLIKAMGMIATAVDADRAYIWKNSVRDEALYFTQLYEWSENVEPQQDYEYTKDFPFSLFPLDWQETLLQEKCINTLVRNMPSSMQKIMSPQDIVSIVLIPVFLQDQFWGFVGFDDCHSERIFTKEEESILHSASLMIANSFISNEMIKSIHETSAQLELALEKANAAS